VGRQQNSCAIFLLRLIRRAVGMRNRDRRGQATASERVSGPRLRAARHTCWRVCIWIGPKTNEVRVLIWCRFNAESDSRSRLEPNPAVGYGRIRSCFCARLPGSDTFHESLTYRVGWLGRFG